MDYWNAFWKSQAKTSQGQHPQAQVLRTVQREPATQEVLAEVVKSICAMLQPKPPAALLDLCCGNGAITRELVGRFAQVTAVDVAPEFVAHLRRGAPRHLTAVVGDVKKIKFPARTFDRILLYAALQYFSEAETIELFSRLHRWLRPGGIAVLGDIPDATRCWAFFNSPEREAAFFDGLRQQKPLIGQWFRPDWLSKLASYSKFSSAEVKRQKATLPYRHYRFDLILKA